VFDKLEAIEKKYEELERLIGDPRVLADPPTYREHARAYSELEGIVVAFRDYRKTLKELAEAKDLASSGAGGDSSLAQMARDEAASLEERRRDLEERLKVLLIPRDPNDEKSVILEVRAGTGGEEASLFAGEIFRMYTRYAENRGWKTALLSANETGVGGFKEVIFEVDGKGAYSRLKYESGVHRVQRVPTTEAQGRIHTSTATVAVLPAAEEVDIQIPDKDIEIDVYKSAGAGGQNVQKNATAVRIRHLPTGIVVQCQDERSQLQNKMRAMSILRARLYELEEQKRLSELTDTRRSQVGTGERSEKIRTYNFPQNRVTDHRINLTSYRLETVLDGGLDEFIDELATRDQAEKLQAAQV
jgi:peptide chain release factor 1